MVATTFSIEAVRLSCYDSLQAMRYDVSVLSGTMPRHEAYVCANKA